MGSKCCKTIHDGVLGKAEDTLVDYKGKYVNLADEFSALTDTESDEDVQAEKPLLNQKETCKMLAQKNIQSNINKRDTI
ncbi:myristylated tegument protein [macacine betaherpesvirus 9]|uniref:Cytoplasmic envelopment protein 3 n=1 Tax=macacine betaherpesvirus 9 TaxID=2560568 RepID=A0A191S3W8_9BETA|nr:myristylated tegument protein [macacine betaherpesvirus 9]ANC96593.1 myristylated tegument protein [macacine betaherpesvirus 9]